MIRRTSGSTERLHLLHEERQQRAFVLDGGLGHRVEVGLVGRTATLGNHHKAIFSTFTGLDVNLGREVATGVHLVVHIQRSILRIAQVVLRIGVIDTEREGFLILEAGPYLLSLLTMDNGCTCILAEWKNTLHRCLRIAEELQGYILIVLRGFGVGENGCHLLVVSTAEHKLAVVESLLSKQRQGFLADLQNFVSFKFACANAFLGEQAVLRVVLSKLEHWSILKIGCCHNGFCILIDS